MSFLDNSTQFTGRKARVGKTFLVRSDDGSERIGVFVAYCPECRFKVLLTRQETIQLFRKHRAVSRSARERVIRYMLSKIEYPGDIPEVNQRKERHAEYVMSKF